MTEANLDVVALVLSRVSPHDRFSCQRVSKAWQQAALLPLATNLTFATQELKGGSRATQIPQPTLEKYIYPIIKTLIMNGYPPNIIPFWPPKTLKLPSLECIDYVTGVYYEPTFFKLITEIATPEKITRIPHLDIGASLWSEPAKLEFMSNFSVLTNLKYLNINCDEPTAMEACLAGLLPNLEHAIMNKTTIVASRLMTLLNTRTSPSPLRSLDIRMTGASFGEISDVLSCFPCLEDATLDIRCQSLAGKSHSLKAKSLKRLTLTPHRVPELGVECEMLEYLKFMSPSQYGDDSGPTKQLHLLTPKLLELDVTAPGLWNIDYANGNLATYPPTLRRLRVCESSIMMCDGPVTSVAECCPELEWLQIENCPIFCNLSMAHPLPKLKFLEISRCSDFTTIIIDDYNFYPKLEVFLMENNPKLSYIAFEEDTPEILASLHTLSLDCSPKVPPEIVTQLVKSCPRLISLKATKHPQKLTSMIAAAIGAERMKNAQVTGKLLGDAVWNAKYSVFNKSSNK